MRNFIDLHQDLLLHMKRKDMYPDPNHVQTSPKMVEEANTRMLAGSIFPVTESEDHFSDENNSIITKELEEYKALCKDQGWKLVKEARDIDDVYENAKTGLLLHIEGLNAINEENLHLLDRWHEGGVRSVGIVWNLTNNLGGGAKDGGQGLTELGKRVLRWTEAKGIVFDFAHMNQETFWDAVKITQRPIVVTHGNAYSIEPNPRNYKDEQLKAVAKSGGVVGIFFPTSFLKKDSDAVTLDDVVSHVRHFAHVMGVDHVAIGSDFGGILSNFVEGLGSVSEIHNLWDALSAGGFSDNEINKIAHENGRRVLKEILN
jgi:membrane dipeptidase